MKRTIKKVISFLLTALLLFACVAVGASAATKETVYQYGKAGGYLAIGDSISRGCGTTGFYKDKDGNPLPEGEEGGQYDEYFMRNVEGAVPTQIAEAVGCEMPYYMKDQNATFWPLCYPGMTTAVTLDLLGIDDDYSDTGLKYSYYKDMLEYFGWEGSFTGAKGETYNPETDGKCGNPVELIKNCDLITLQLGMCDIFYRAYRIISNGGMLADGLSFDLSSPEAIKKLVETAINEMKFGYEYWESHYPMLLEAILDLNPDVTLVMVGSFNLVDQLTIMDETMAPIGNIINVITDKMNRKYVEWAKKYNVLYADISNTETQATENDWALLGDFKDNTFTGTHPTQKGYDYIVRQILLKLPEYETVGNIKVDLARFDKVDYVLVNGIPVKNYTMDGFNVIIPYSGPLATSLTIAVKNDDGTVAMQYYTLKYDKDNGYTAHRVTGNNDVKGYILRPFELFKKLFKMIIDAIKGLFNK